MSNSWKMGAVSGLIAGFVAGIVSYVCNLIVLDFGITYIELYPGALFRNVAEYFIIMGLLWGVILGIIFSKAYGMIPGKKIFKGICFGFVLFLFGAFRDITFWIPYGVPLPIALSHIFVWFFGSIVIGTLLGILYRKDVESVGKFDFGKGFQVSVIAGLIGGIAASLSVVPINLWLFGLVPDSEAIMVQAVNHITLNALWGVLFGLVYTKVYDLVPSKGVLKGLVYSLIIFFCFESGHIVTYYFAQGSFINVIHTGVVGGLRAIVFGLVLGYLYRKPGD
jgi:hypothetical protein